MTTIPLTDILKIIRPLPWPVNGKVVNEGSMTQEQLEMTRIYRRHAANTLPESVAALRQAKQLIESQSTLFTEYSRNTALRILSQINKAIAEVEIIKIDP